MQQANWDWRHAQTNSSLNYLRTGVLTYDGVHPNATGNGLLADHIIRGIHKSLNKLEDR